MQHHLRCTIHNVEYGFEALPAPYNAALVDCPCCAYDRLCKLREKCEQTMEQRDLLLKAIDLAKTLQPL